MDTHIIDINDGSEYSYKGLSYLQRKLITKIIYFRNLYFSKNDFLFDSIYLSTPLTNILSDSSHFHAAIYDDSLYLGEEERPIGILSDMQVYVDHNLKRNQILITINKSKIRDIKISTIINDLESKVCEVMLEVNSDLI